MVSISRQDRGMLDKATEESEMSDSEVWDLWISEAWETIEEEGGVEDDDEEVDDD